MKTYVITFIEGKDNKSKSIKNSRLRLIKTNKFSINDNILIIKNPECHLVFPLNIIYDLRIKEIKEEK